MTYEKGFNDCKSIVLGIVEKWDMEYRSRYISEIMDLTPPQKPKDFNPETSGLVYGKAIIDNCHQHEADNSVSIAKRKYLNDWINNDCN